MTFPVTLNKEYLLDFRYIPVLIAYIFGGFWSGLILSILLISCQFAVGDTGFYLGSLLVTIILSAAFKLILPRKDRWNASIRKLYPYLLLSGTLVFYVIGAPFLDHHKFTHHEFTLLLWFSCLNYLTFWMMMYFQNMKLHMEMISETIIQFEKNNIVNQLLVSISQQLLFSLHTAKELLFSFKEEHLTARHAYEIQKIEKEIHCVTRCLNHYLSLLNDKQARTGEWNFVKELDDIIQLMKLYANMKQVELHYISTAQEDMSIKGNYSIIRFALINIIKNAIDTCESKGNVNISLHEMLKEVYIVIEENGKGMSEACLTQMREPLQSIKENGIELGLASTLKITELSGGRVEVESKPNEGTTFSLYFPKWAL